jgi:hypothetical protein
VTNVADILEKAASLIEPEGAWTQFTSARDASGEWVDADSAGAVCFCTVGAIHRVVGHNFSAATPAFYAFEDLILCDTARWNDHPSRTQSEVVAKLREAAAKARAS